MVFLVVMHGCERWTIKKADSWRIDVFELWCWRRLLRVPWTARRLNQSILKEISPEYSLEGLMVKLKLQYFGHLMQSIGKDPDAGKDWRQEEKGMTDDDMIGWHHWLHGHGFGWTPGVGDGQGGLECCSWGRKELDTTEWPNWTEWLMMRSFHMLISHSYNLLEEMSIQILCANGNPLQYSCLKIQGTEEPGRLLSMGLQSQTRLSNWAWLSMLALNCKCSLF